MTTESARYTGAALYDLLVNLQEGAHFAPLSCGVANCFLVNRQIPVLFKISKKRVGPWTFNFHRTHQENHQKLVNEFGDCIVALICGSDGVAAIASSDWRAILDENFEEQESVSVRRGLRKMYSLSGRDGVLRRRVSRQSLRDLITGYCPMEST